MKDRTDAAPASERRKLKDRVEILEKLVCELDQRLTALEPAPCSSTPDDHEHAFDRQVIAAVRRRERAAAGLGFKFNTPTRGSS